MNEGLGLICRGIAVKVETFKNLIHGAFLLCMRHTFVLALPLNKLFGPTQEKLCYSPITARFKLKLMTHEVCLLVIFDFLLVWHLE